MSDDFTLFGYRIVRDVREVPGTRIWVGEAAVVEPADAFGVERVHSILVDAFFTTEKAASDYLIAEAKKWIKNQIRNQITNVIAHKKAAVGRKAQRAGKAKLPLGSIVSAPFIYKSQD